MQLRDQGKLRLDVPIKTYLPWFNIKDTYPADTYMQYSNLGLTLAGEVVAAVSGISYANYVQQHILDPLGLKDTFPEIPQDHKARSWPLATAVHVGTAIEKLYRFTL